MPITTAGPSYPDPVCRSRREVDNATCQPTAPAIATVRLVACRAFAEHHQCRVGIDQRSDGQARWHTAARRPVSHIRRTEPSFAQSDGDSLDLVDDTAAHVMAASESARHSLIGQTRREPAPRGRAQHIVDGIQIYGLASAPGFVLANLVLQPAAGSLSACAADAFIGRAGGADGQASTEGGRPHPARYAGHSLRAGLATNAAAAGASERVIMSQTRHRSAHDCQTIHSRGESIPGECGGLSWVMSSFVPCASRCPEEQPHLDRWT